MARVLVHTLNGSALAWARIWAALVETGRRADGSVVLPEVLGPLPAGPDGHPGRRADAGPALDRCDGSVAGASNR